MSSTDVRLESYGCQKFQAPAVRRRNADVPKWNRGAARLFVLTLVVETISRFAQEAASSLKVDVTLDRGRATGVLDGVCCNQVCMILHLTTVTVRAAFDGSGAGARFSPFDIPRPLNIVRLGVVIGLLSPDSQPPCWRRGRRRILYPRFFGGGIALEWIWFRVGRCPLPRVGHEGVQKTS